MYSRRSTLFFRDALDPSLFDQENHPQESKENLDKILFDLKDGQYSGTTRDLVENFTDEEGKMTLESFLLVAKKFGRRKQTNQSLFKWMNWLFMMIVFLFVLSMDLVIGLSLNTVHKIDANKDTLVDPSLGKMMAKNLSAASASALSSSRRLISS